MVYLPSSYLLSAAVAAIGLQIQQTKAASMYYEPVTVSGALHTLGPHFPGYGAKILGEDCAFTVEIDPTLPDITTIQSVSVVYMDLLANTSVPPVEPVFTKVGEVIMSEEAPAKNANPDAYIDPDMPEKSGDKDCATGWEETTVVVTEKKPGNDGAGKGDKSGAKDCTTGWEETTVTRKLGDSVVSGHALDEKMETARRLEVDTNYNLASLEAYFGFKFEMKLANLPTVGVYRPAPWSGPYWATANDSINVVWQKGQPSPAEKYAKAFGLDVTSFMDRVSRIDGVDSQRNSPRCQSNADCVSTTTDVICGKRANATSGYCIPRWFGICHAWAAAAILESEPNCPVTYNGVTFQPMDIKGLITSIYDGSNAPVIYTGARFNDGNNKTDQYGRPYDVSFRDINPAFLYIVAANLLGLHNTTFIVDVDAKTPVWNHPLRGFRVVEQTAMTLEVAAQTFYGLQEYPWNAAAYSIVYVKLRLSWVIETFENGGLVSSGRINKYTTGKFYHILLELDEFGFIIGAEWVYISDMDHPDFLWVATGKPDVNTVTRTGLSYANVRMLMEKSVACTDSA